MKTLVAVGVAGAVSGAAMTMLLGGLGSDKADHGVSKVPPSYGDPTGVPAASAAPSRSVAAEPIPEDGLGMRMDVPPAVPAEWSILSSLPPVEPVKPIVAAESVPPTLEQILHDFVTVDPASPLSAGEPQDSTVECEDEIVHTPEPVELPPTAASVAASPLMATPRLEAAVSDLPSRQQGPKQPDAAQPELDASTPMSATSSDQERVTAAPGTASDAASEAARTAALRRLQSMTFKPPAIAPVGTTSSRAEPGNEDVREPVAPRRPAAVAANQAVPPSPSGDVDALPTPSNELARAADSIRRLSRRFSGRIGGR